MARQLALDLPVRTALGREDFFVAPENEDALRALDDWLSWPMGRMVLTGPAGAGKTHLAHVWASGAGARLLAAPELAGDRLPRLASGPLALEDADRCLRDETALFHLLNLAAENGAPVLLTARTPPTRWSIGLADLASRLEAAPVARLLPPGDGLIRAVLVKLFNDRQIEVRPALISWLATRLDRSLGAARTAVERLDRAALARGVPVTRALAAEVLDIPAEGDP